MREDIYHEMYRVEDAHWWFSAKREIIRSLLSRFAKSAPGARLRVADLGCGCGRLLEELCPSCDAAGIDLSPTAVEFCAKRGVTAVLGALPDNIPLPENSFDAVILSDIIEHVDDDAAAVRAAARLLRPGGVMILTVPACPSLWSSWDEAHGHKRRYTARALRGAFAGAGLDVELLSFYNTFLFPAAVAGRFAKKIARRPSTAELALPPRWLNSILRSIFAAERHFLGALPLPFGLSLVAVLRKR
jgi:SAM-dependent methyltransferase